jgi:PAS domain S-box-containing protein
VCMRAKDGSAVYLETQVDIVVSDDRPYKFQVVARNITLRKKAEQALLESEQKYKSIVENSSDLIMLSKPDGIVVYASPSIFGITGYKPEDIEGRLPDIIHPDDLDMVSTVFSEAPSGKGGSNFEYRIVTVSGETKWVSHAWSPIMDRGQVQTVLSVVRDITDRKTSEGALRQAHAELEQSYMLQREFLNNVTHEVRTPLTAVKGYAEMLMEGVAGPISDEQSALLKKVLTSSQHLLDVVNGVLQMARLKSGRIAIYPRVCDPRLIVEKSVSAVLPQAQRKGLAINVGPCCTGCLGTYDEEKLLIILTNLLTNAVKFTEAGSVDVLVTCCSSGTQIIVIDTGMGIEESDIRGIFVEFQQLDYPHKHKPSGFGIGLAIVATMVDAIGASLAVSSLKGTGTAFTLCVPVLQV